MPARCESRAHAQRTRSFIISFAVLQTLHMRIKLALYFGSSMLTVRIGSWGPVQGRAASLSQSRECLVASKKFRKSRSQHALGMQPALVMAPA